MPTGTLSQPKIFQNLCTNFHIYSNHKVTCVCVCVCVRACITEAHRIDTISRSSQYISKIACIDNNYIISLRIIQHVSRNNESTLTEENYKHIISNQINLVPSYIVTSHNSYTSYGINN